VPHRLFGGDYEATFEAEKDANDATSKRITKNITVIFYYAASISHRRSCLSSSIARGTILSA
jgi:hypothetical protein